MNEVERLRNWMTENNLTKRGLANRMGFSYDGIYQALKTRGDKLGHVSPGFKWHFKQAFGAEIADKIFDADPQPVVAEQVA